jgi:prepilin-type N-terminal cleavage/methylation domain-containing protein
VDLSRPQGGAAGDSGFTLIEMVIALMLLTVVITAFANGFVGALFASGDAQMKEVAVTVADTALDKARAVTPASNLLLEGPAAGTVSSNVVLTNTSNAVVLDPQTTTLDSRVFTANLYAGSCYLQATGQCTTTAPSNPTPMIRVIAYVTWSAPGCGNCSYVASTLISNGNDSILNINPNAAPGAPGSPTAAAGNDQVTVSWTAPVSEYPVSGYTATVTGGAQSCNTSTSTSCTVTGLTNGTAYTFTVTATSAGGTSVPSDRPAAGPQQCGGRGWQRHGDGVVGGRDVAAIGLPGLRLHGHGQHHQYGHRRRLVDDIVNQLPGDRADQR